MPVSSRNGWGLISAFQAVTKSAAGVNSVLGNIGAAIQVIAGGGPIRLTKVFYRVDLAPDVASGTVISPTRWRLVVVEGDLPPDVSIFQAQAWSAGAHPEIPANVSTGAPLPILHDVWLDFSAGDPGLNQLASIDFADAGPTVAGHEKLGVLLVPIMDANLGQSIQGAANAMITLSAYGTGVTSNPLGGLLSGDNGSASVPRFDVRIR